MPISVESRKLFCQLKVAQLLLDLNVTSTVLNPMNASFPPLLSFNPCLWRWAKFLRHWLKYRLEGRGGHRLPSLRHFPEYKFVFSSLHGPHGFLSCLWDHTLLLLVSHPGCFGTMAPAQSLTCLSRNSGTFCLWFCEAALRVTWPGSSLSHC